MIFIWIVLPIIAIGAVGFYLFRKIYRAVDFFKAEMKKSKKNISAIVGTALILSGHTHAGQILPIGLISPLFHMNDLNYGYVKESNLNEIVTSGIAGWGYPIRTEKHSEYAIIDIKNK